jgi:hypothetical protein
LLISSNPTDYANSVVEAGSGEGFEKTKTHTNTSARWAHWDLNKNSFESKYRTLGYARKGGAMFVQ